MKIKILFSALACLTLCSCTTLRKNTQTLKIASNPEGADVFVNDIHLGTTPGFFEIRRASEETLKIKKKGYKDINYPLVTTYRWVDSFVSDFIWLSVAPVAWGLDFITHTAWKYDRVPLFNLAAPTKLKNVDNRKKTIAIAPPQSDSEFLSDETQLRLEALSKSRYKMDVIKSVAESEGLFDGYGYDNSSKTNPQIIDELYKDLKITHFLESEISQNETEVVVVSKLLDVYTEKEVDSFTTHFKNLKTANWSWFKRLRYSAVDIVPNTIGIDFVTPVVSFTILSNTASTEEYKSVEDKASNIGSFISTIVLRNIKDQEFMKYLRVTLRLVPNISFNHDKFHFERPDQINILQGYSFSWYTLLLGIGPEVGIETPAGYYYLQIVPCYAQNWINGTGNGQDISSAMNSIQLAAEIGYEFYISSRFNFRLFARSTNPPTDPWNQLLTNLTGQPLLADTVAQTVGGISIGYFFPEAKSYLKHNIY